MKHKSIAILGVAHSMLQHAMISGHQFKGDVLTLAKTEEFEYHLRPMTEDIDQPNPPSAYRKPRSKYTPHVGKKELQRVK